MAEELPGTAGEELQGDPIPETPAPSPGTTAPVESFINPADLPPELKPHWSRMHSAYTKALDKTKGDRDAGDTVRRFWSDRQFAEDSIRQWAQQNGVQISFGAASPAQPTPGTSQIPQELVAAIQTELPAELRWMAPALAASTWKAQATVLAPFLQQNQQDRLAARTATYEELASELTETAPGWEEHEDTMNELLDFLQGPNLRHRQFGSKLAVLHAIVTGNASATRDAVRRIGEAARNRTATGGPGRSTVTNIAERVRGARSNDEAWKIAAAHAVQTLKESGVSVPQG